MHQLPFEIITVLLYLAATLTQSLRLRQDTKKPRLVFLLLGGLALCTHAYLLHMGIDVGGGQHLSTFNLLSLTLWSIALVLLLFTLVKPIDNLALLVYPLAAISVILAQSLASHSFITTNTEPKQLIHIILSTLAFSTLGLAAFQATLLALQHRLLHSNLACPVRRLLPPLETMEQILFQLIGFGFSLLTLVIISALVNFQSLLSPLLWQKLIAACVAWLLFASLLIGRHYYGWRGPKAVVLTLLGMLLLVVTYFGGPHFMKWIHYA